MRIFFLLFWCFLATGCISKKYLETDSGKFQGSLDVRWVNGNKFVFIPNKNDPLIFIRKNGESIEPKVMYTDGGSIPRFLWSFKGYSPWDFAPAYMIHDWVFEEKHCNSNPKYNFKDSVSLMGETLKTVMENNGKPSNHFVFDSVITAVSSPMAKKIWSEGQCDIPPLVLPSPVIHSQTPEGIFPPRPLGIPNIKKVDNPKVKGTLNTGELIKTIKFD